MKLCAHGCGTWRGWRRPNCAEAFVAAAKNGFRNVEVDVSVTKNGEFVMGHDDRGIADMDSADYLGRRSPHGGTRLSLNRLIEISADLPYSRIMVDFRPGWRSDRPDNLRMVATLLLQAKDSGRFMLSAYSESDAKTVLDAGFENVILWLGNRYRRFNPIKEMAFRKADFALTNGIRFVSFGEKHIHAAKSAIERLRAGNVEIWTAGWNSRADLKRASKLGVDVATVDCIVPGGTFANLVWCAKQKTWISARRAKTAICRQLGMIEKPAGKKVFLVGVFDLLHFGHFELFRRAKALAGPGGKLTVAVQDDEFVLKYKPTANIVIPLENRISMIETLRTVDRVVIYTDVDKIVKELAFDVFVVGGDQTHAGFQRAIEWCKENGREVVRLSRTPGVSSSKLRKGIAKTVERTEKQP